MDQNLIGMVLKFIYSLLDKYKVNLPIQLPPMPEIQHVENKTEIDWNNPEVKISRYFTVKDALYLNSWKTYHMPTEDQKVAILGIAKNADKALDYISQKLGKPVVPTVHAWIRPEQANCPNSPYNGQNYNTWIYKNEVWKNLTEEEKAKKHVPLSPHRTGHAIDFHIVGFEGIEGCAKIRAMIVEELEELQIRMEDIVGAWVHWDNLAVIISRFFKP